MGVGEYLRALDRRVLAHAFAGRWFYGGPGRVTIRIKRNIWLWRIGLLAVASVAIGLQRVI
ncbi:MAG TPA: hypothetical protein VHE83_07060 [Mycobacteriales bacterium]|nr:hypothetical protein [Mycobacteriales bacterium]